MACPTIETSRLTLRPPRADDLPQVVALGADPEVMRYIRSGRPHSAEEAGAWFEKILQDGREGLPGPPGLPGWMVVNTKPAGAWAGMATLQQLKVPHAEAVGTGSYVEVGYRLARPFWGQGFATEAAAALLRFGFLDLELPLITAIAQAENLASNRVIQKIGLVYQKSYSLDGMTIHFHALGRADYLRNAAVSR